MKGVGVAHLGGACVAAVSAVSFFGKGGAVSRRYRSWGVSMPLFVLGGIVVHTIEVALHALLFASQLGWLFGTQRSFAFLYIELLSVFWAATGLGYAAHLLAASEDNAQLLCLLCIISSAVLSSVTMPLPRLKRTKAFKALYPLTYVSFIRYSIEAAMVAELTHYVNIYNVSVALDIQGFTRDAIYPHLLKIAGLGLGLRVFAVLLAAGGRCRC
uniref:ABC-2 type transporter transmembrane domain-containing protein n=1 Tax=Haptolina brevifila TaxID=156173 RepID=A0A6U7DGG5_9EUKA|mmetsp:Transcript_24952/g.50134  ORF Transcript_24952/g.50134 Transcript_24952/m.50134 type:complete len:214 (+) Transcript_24952:268-909(+)|eukprot:CAMPEP_0174750728 /NCGR_PEP_ID=MMETSP1094-20130205/98352_1 /TAXON_ID=156173 /ORGANISM="Chrysochromulina brevifilum, Strain UTEX LB 985" /LENGTH=213 /DNA_ID=CAMNT_0015956119 /DNA_START=399 /DNA_END=1040 /DNA_ORIENTATION=-